MLETRLFLTCDDCGNPFPRVGNCPAPVDAAFETPTMLRADARKGGWQRYGGQDFCSECEKNNRYRALHSPDDSDAPAKKGDKR